jgi:phenylpyruvate tautomerase PptA (4-oxalocrotonate tautomerase family)
VPHAAIHRLRDVEPKRRRDIIQAVNGAIIEALKVPNDTHPTRLCAYDPDTFLIPKESSDRFTLVEITIYPGRSLETRRSLYKAVVDRLGALGIDPLDVRVVLYEVPLENWGLRGGIPASEIDLGFEIAI